ncbi:preprotein translocase subunit SecE [Bacteroidota bacterium]
MKEFKEFLVEIYTEMRYKVVWPKYKDLQSSSILVLIASLIFAIIIGVIDLGFDNIMNWYYAAF